MDPAFEAGVLCGTTGPTATIQVHFNGAGSNTAAVLVSATAPGVFWQNGPGRARNSPPPRAIRTKVAEASGSRTHPRHRVPHNGFEARAQHRPRLASNAQF